jgi:dihydrofolate reductase
VPALKGKDDGDLYVIGSTKLVQALIEHDLVDEFRVMIDPLVVGGGFRLFSDDGALRKLQLFDNQVTSTARSSLRTVGPPIDSHRESAGHGDRRSID